MSREDYAGEDPTVVASGMVVASMVRRMTSPVLVGRTAAVEQSLAAVTSARAGEPRHVIVGGEAGVGKTRLLSRVRELAEADGVRVLIGGCVPVGDAGLPFAPYTQLLHALVEQDGAAQVVALAGRASVDLGRLVPLLSPEEAPPTQEPWAQTRLYEGLLHLLERLARRTPLVVQLEDLHWADAGTLAATAFLLRVVRSEPISIMATYRAEEVSDGQRLRPWLAEVSRSEGVDRLDLEPLDRTELAELVANVTGERMASSTLDRLYERSDGNPFFAEELLAAGAHSSGALPQSLRDVLLARIESVDAQQRRLLDVAAIGGREVDHDLLATALKEPESEWSDVLRALVEAGLLTATSVAGHDKYVFRHALLQEVVHDAILAPEHRRLHRAYAEALEPRADGPMAGAMLLVELAHHWREAGDPRALRASIRAGSAAIASFAFDIALGEHEQALRMWDPAVSERDSGLDHLDLLERTARAAHLSAHDRRAKELCRQAIEELGDSDAARRCELQVLLGRVLWRTGEWGAAVPAYEEALASAPLEPPRARIRALAGLGQIYMLCGWFRRAQPLCTEAVAQARAIGARDLEGHALNTLGAALAGVGRTDAGLEAMERALAIAVELDIADDIGRAHVNRADIIAWAGHPQRACSAALEGIEVVERMGMASFYGTSIRFGLVDHAFQAGDWDLAAEQLAEADRIAPDTEGSRLYRGVYVLDFLASSGSEEAVELWPWVRAKLADRPPNEYAGAAYAGAVEMAALAGRPEEAVELAWEGLGMLAHQDCWVRAVELVRVAAGPVADVGAQARAAGDERAVRAAEERIDQLAERVREAAVELGHPGDTLGALLDLDAAQIEAERGRARGSPDPDAWRAVADGWSAVGQPYRELLARWRQAEAADAEGDREQAVGILRDTHARAIRLGARPLRAHLELLARRIRVNLGSAAEEAAGTAEAPFALTPREQEVLALVAAGRTNRQIAQALFISESTAGVHVSNILGKLGVSSRTEAASVALSQGLVELDEGK